MANHIPKGKWLKRERPPLWTKKIDWSKLHRVPPFLQPDDENVTEPPWGRGHFDRYYFTNCSESYPIDGATAKLREDATGNMVLLEDMGPLAPWETKWVGHPGESFKSKLLEVWLKLKINGEDWVAYYPCSLDPDALQEMGLDPTDETIVAVNLGISFFHRGDANPVPCDEFWGIIFGSDGTRFPVNPAKIVYELAPPEEN